MLPTALERACGKPALGIERVGVGLERRDVVSRASPGCAALEEHVVAETRGHVGTGHPAHSIDLGGQLARGLFHAVDLDQCAHQKVGCQNIVHAQIQHTEMAVRFAAGGAVFKVCEVTLGPDIEVGLLRRDQVAGIDPECCQLFRPATQLALFVFCRSFCHPHKRGCEGEAAGAIAVEREAERQGSRHGPTRVAPLPILRAQRRGRIE